MDAIELLTTQHREMEAILKQATNAESPEAVSALFARAADELSVHLASEEQVFYPAVRAERTEDILLESLEEHLSLKRLLADLLLLSPSEQTFTPKFKVLKEQAEHHHKEEEEHLFPKVRNLLSTHTLATLGAEMQVLQEKLTSRGEPRTDVADQTDEAAPL